MFKANFYTLNGDTMSIEEYKNSELQVSGSLECINSKLSLRPKTGDLFKKRFCI